MTENHISLTRVNLHYSAAAFAERSLKSYLAGALLNRNPRRRRDIHALRDINLRIGPGERVGLLGQNGAGKSTLLKVIAGLYPTSAGIRIVEGTVRSVFEIGLGFEPDSTGRENILYRGLLLGLSPRFMRAVEQEVVVFADLGEFIDYPIKTYSTGMLVRIAFAISTIVGGDILLLDEIISAGDAHFMTKARKRVMNLVEQSEILVLASHDLNILAAMCQRGIVLHHGEIVFDGSIFDAITRYNEISGVPQ
jgi:lipopolysaccharide transport system ATP-binding protein